MRATSRCAPTPANHVAAVEGDGGPPTPDPGALIGLHVSSSGTPALIACFAYDGARPELCADGEAWHIAFQVVDGKLVLVNALDQVMVPATFCGKS